MRGGTSAYRIQFTNPTDSRVFRCPDNTFGDISGIALDNSLKREYPHFVLQELTVNSECHRDYAIRGTEIQVKMFDDRLVFESPGTLPGNVKPDNIRHTHFSRNPHIAQFLKAYKFVKEFGEGVDRMSREMEAVDMLPPTYHLDAFILKVTARACPPVNKTNKENDVPVNVPVNFL